MRYPPFATDYSIPCLSLSIYKIDNIVLLKIVYSAGLTHLDKDAIIIIVEGNTTDHEEVIKMLKYNYETMRYERVDDKRPDLLADKLENDFDYGDYDIDYDY